MALGECDLCALIHSRGDYECECEHSEIGMEVSVTGRRMRPGGSNCFNFCFSLHSCIASKVYRLLICFAFTSPMSRRLLLKSSLKEGLVK